MKLGKLEVITGPMFTEKSLELIKRAQQLEAGGHPYIAFSPIKDVIFSRAIEETIDAVRIPKETPALIAFHTGIAMGRGGLHTVFIDEVQFYEQEVIYIIDTLLANGLNIIAAGLDQTFTTEPFGVMGHLLCLADDIMKKKTTCAVCGAGANRSQRLLNGKPASFDSPLVIVDGSSDEYTYEPRCASCFQRG
jgi:thymidine kinase